MTPQRTCVVLYGQMPFNLEIRVLFFLNRCFVMTKVIIDSVGSTSGRGKPSCKTLEGEGCRSHTFRSVIPQVIDLNGERELCIAEICLTSP